MRFMDRRGLDRLFHSIVVVGAAIGAAGCPSTVTQEGTSSGTGGSGGSGTGSSSSTSTGSAGGSSTGGGGQGGSSGITQPSDCPSTTQFFCDFTPNGTVCYCDMDAPLGPEACENTQDFQCEQYQPDYVGCHCDPNAPLVPEDCPPSFFFACAIKMPPIGCQCLVPIV